MTAILPQGALQPVAGSRAPMNPFMSPWQADCGDGTYRNPVLFADYSDPDVVRVGDEYWMTSSSFSHVPGLPILHSRDLVNWTLVNHALPQLVPVEHFREPRHGGGVWAPSIRHHQGRFVIYYPDPDFGIYVVSAVDPRGLWSAPTLVRGGRGLIDPCPFWDEDGQGYLVHGWAKSRSGVCNRLTLHRLSMDGTKTVDDGMVIIDADQMPGWKTLEGPKLYKRTGYYYVFAPAGGVETGYQAVFRSRSIYGPYEAKIVLAQGSTPINGPHQGGWVDAPSGEHWFVHFQDRGAYGRIVHLQPVVWGADDWPVMGRAGEPVLKHTKPKTPTQPIAVPATSDEFDGPTLGRQWQWQANPNPEWATVGPKGLRLSLVPSTGGRSLWYAPNLLMQKFPAPQFRATTRMALSPTTVGDVAGLVVFGYSYAWLGLCLTSAGVRLTYRTCHAANEAGAEIERANVAVMGDCVFLRVSVDPYAKASFAYSLDGAHFVPIGEPFQATVSKWVGAKVGLFGRALNLADKTGHAQFDWFHVEA